MDMTTINNDLPRLCLNMHDELYVIDLGQTIYFMADDHYTHVFYSNGVRFMVPFGLSRVEERMALLAVHHHHPFKRVGRKYIVNMSLVHNVNVTKQTLTLLADNSKMLSLQVSKPVLRDLMSDFAAESASCLFCRECQLTLLLRLSTDFAPRGLSASRREVMHDEIRTVQNAK